MSTCRELAILAKSNPAMKDQLSLREKSHREPLKAKEKLFRSNPKAVHADELVEFKQQCENELEEGDSLLKRVRLLTAASPSNAAGMEENLQAIVAKMDGKKNATCKFLNALLVQASSYSPQNEEQSRQVCERIQQRLKDRVKSHRSVLEREVKQVFTLKDMARLKQKLLSELAPGDELFDQVEELEKKRAPVKQKFVTKLTQLVSGTKKFKTDQVSQFLKDALEELEEEDAIVVQIKSLLETKLLQDGGLKVVHEVKPHDDEEEPAAGKRRRKYPSPSVLDSSRAFVRGLSEDLSGAPSKSSSFYKLGLLLCILLYAAIVSNSAALTFKVIHVELPDLSLASTKLMEKIRLRKHPIVLQDTLAVAKPPPQAAAATPPVSEEKPDNDDEEEDD